MCLAFTLFAALFYKLGVNMDKKNRRLMKIAGKYKGVVDEELTIPIYKRIIAPAINGVVKSFSRLLPAKKESSRLEKSLILAGIRMSVVEYSALRAVYVFVGLAITISIVFLSDFDALLKLLVYAAGILLSIGGPVFYLSFRIKKRQEAVRHQLPDILDLLAVSVEAGLSFDAALMYIEEFYYGPLVDELTVVKNEIQMGLPRREALKNLTERNSVPELKAFVGALIQSDQIGLPLRNVMQAQSSQLRLFRKQAAEEKAMKAPVKMMLPLIAFIFPVTFIILLGPAVMKIVETFAK